MRLALVQLALILSLLGGYALSRHSTADAPLGLIASTPISQTVPVAERKAPKEEFIELTVQDVLPLMEAEAHAILLVTREGTVLPIFVDQPAALAIAFRLAHKKAPHPLAEDLLDDLVHRLGGKVTEVRLTDVQNLGSDSLVLIKKGSEMLSVPARPSDSIAMALTSGAKIFATRELLERIGITAREIEDLRKELGIGGSGETQKPADAAPDTELSL